MKKIPTLFEQTFENHKVTGITDKVTPGMEWVLEGEGVATIKYDGACCAIIDGIFHKRFDVKHGEKPPEGAFPCCDPDPITGHWPHWVRVDAAKPEDKWFAAAESESLGWILPDGTYEAVGRHFQGNPYGLTFDMLMKHGSHEVKVDRSFEGIREYLRTHTVEGLVFWRDGEPMCKIKRTDFGFPWPVKED